MKSDVPPATFGACTQVAVKPKGTPTAAGAGTSAVTPTPLGERADATTTAVTAATQCTCETAKSGSKDDGGGGGGGGDSDALTVVVVILAIMQVIHVAANAFAYYQGTKAASAPTTDQHARNHRPTTRATANPIYSAGNVVEADADGFQA